MGVYTCFRVYVYTCTRVDEEACGHVDGQTRIRVYVYTHTRVDAYASTPVDACTCIRRTEVVVKQILPSRKLERNAITSNPKLLEWKRQG